MPYRSLLLSLLIVSAPQTASAELLVGNKSAASVWRLSQEDGRKLGEFATGEGPHEIAVSADGAMALVANYGTGQSAGHSVSVLDLRGGKAPRVIDLGEHTRPHGLRFLPGNRQAVATTEASQDLVLIDLEAGKVAASVAMGEGKSHMVALSADGKTAYVSKVDRGTVSRIDLGERRKVDEQPAGAGAEGVAVQPGAGDVWVSNREAGTITVHDPKTLAIRHTLPSPGFPIRVVFTPDGRHALATNARAATLSVFDAKRKKTVATVELKRKDAKYSQTMLGSAALPIGVIADAKRPRVYVAISGGDEIAVIDSKRWAVIDHWKTGREPDALGIAPD